jgi:hypothetical protein
MVTIARPRHKGLDVWMRRLGGCGVMQWTILNALYRLLFFSHTSLNIIRAGVNVQRVAAVEGRFGHEEDDEKEHDDKSSTHSMHRDAVRSKLNHGPGWVCQHLDDVALKQVSPIGLAKLIPPSTPRLKIAMRKPRSCTYQISPTDAGISASKGALNM